MTLTMKGVANGQGSPWLVVPDSGDHSQSPEGLALWQKHYLLEAFQVDPESELAKRSLVDIFLTLSQEYLKKELIADKFGEVPHVVTEGEAKEGTTDGSDPVKQPPKPAAKRAAKKTAAAPQQAAEAQPEAPAAEASAAEPEKPAHPHQGVLDAIAKAATMIELRSIWDANKAAFIDPSVMAALEAHAKTLA